MLKIATLCATLAVTSVLGGCKTAEPLLTKTETYAVVPPANLYVCPGIGKLTINQINNLTDLQVARHLVKLYKAYGTCSASLQAVHDHVEAAAKRLNQNP